MILDIFPGPGLKHDRLETQDSQLLGWIVLTFSYCLSPQLSRHAGHCAAAMHPNSMFTSVRDPRYNSPNLT